MPFPNEHLRVSVDVRAIPVGAALGVKGIQHLWIRTSDCVRADPQVMGTDLKALFVWLDTAIECSNTHRTVADGSHIFIANFAGLGGGSR